MHAIRRSDSNVQVRKEERRTYTFDAFMLFYAQQKAAQLAPPFSNTTAVILRVRTISTAAASIRPTWCSCSIEPLLMRMALMPSVVSESTDWPIKNRRFTCKVGVV